MLRIELKQNRRKPDTIHCRIMLEIAEWLGGIRVGDSDEVAEYYNVLNSDLKGINGITIDQMSDMTKRVETNLN